MILVCHVVFKGHMIKVTCGQELITVSYDPFKFGCQRHSGSGDLFLVCHAISKDHMITGSCDFMRRSPSR